MTELTGRYIGSDRNTEVPIDRGYTHSTDGSSVNDIEPLGSMICTVFMATRKLEWPIFFLFYSDNKSNFIKTSQQLTLCVTHTTS